MRDFGHIPVETGTADVQVFLGQSQVAGQQWQTWYKPRGKTMVEILLIGKGGNGGTGVIGAAGVAAGGGGGGSGGQVKQTMPLALLPDLLFLSLAGHSTTTTLASYITVQPSLASGGGAPTVNNTLIYANGGGNGGNAAGGTGGSAGSAGAISAVGTMPLGWPFAVALAGHAGTAGGGTSAGVALTLPATGLLITGGTGGGGVAGAGAGSDGGLITGAGVFPTQAGGIGSTAATTPPTEGKSGFYPIPKLLYGYGGTGGGSTHATATGAGLVQASGGNGAPGCGGGGMGGALTASTAGVVGKGGPAICIITCW